MFAPTNKYTTSQLLQQVNYCNKSTTATSELLQQVNYCNKSTTATSHKLQQHFVCRTCLYLHMGWLSLVGSLKLQVSLAKKPYKTDDILQKRPIFLRSLLSVASPYRYISGFFCLLCRNSTTSIKWRASCCSKYATAVL